MRAKRQRLEHFLGHVFEVELDRFEADSPALDFGQVEDAVDQLEQRVAVADDGAQVTPLLVAEVGFHQQIGHPEDRVHRRANFVRHARQEFGLGPRRGQCLLTRGDQFALGHLEVGYFARDSQATEPSVDLHHHPRDEHRPFRSVLHAERDLEVPDLAEPGELIGEGNHFIGMDPHVEVGEVVSNYLFAREAGAADEFLVDVDVRPIDCVQRHAVQVRVEQPAKHRLAFLQSNVIAFAGSRFRRAQFHLAHEQPMVGGERFEMLGQFGSIARVLDRNHLRQDQRADNHRPGDRQIRTRIRRDRRVPQQRQQAAGFKCRLPARAPRNRGACAEEKQEYRSDQHVAVTVNHRYPGGDRYARRARRQGQRPPSGDRQRRQRGGKRKQTQHDAGDVK